MPYGAVIGLSSLLLFLVQPLIARQILPWFGGGAAVWTTCLLFFQTLLLAGYAYAHASSARLAPRAQALVHIGLLIVAIALLPIAPADRWQPSGGEEPVSAILMLLGATVGLQYLLLSSTSPLVQSWFARQRPGANPYRLFALSNFASLAALVGYPLFVEPALTGSEQVTGWSWLFALFALLCAALALRSGALHAVPVASAKSAEAPPHSRAEILHWLSLATAGSALLLAVTNHITQNVAAIPLLWLAPLTLYLVSFIVAFDGRFYRSERFWAPALALVAAMAWLLADMDRHFDLPLQLGVFLSGLFAACLYCHGELYRLRPSPCHLTAFYLTVAAGGALGGLLVAVVAPLAFDGYYELGLALVVTAVLLALRCASLGSWAKYASLGVLMATAACTVYDGLRFQQDVRIASRNFYGVVRVKEYGVPGEPDYRRRLLHGVILHGEQYLHPGYRNLATTYYQETSGVGAALMARREQPGPMRVGVVGLGVGTLAVYGRPGDQFRFYDINPRVVELAKREFTFLEDSEAGVQVELGDARLSLQREAPQGFDVLAVDAFSGDAIPAHLITREALSLYLAHVKPGGVVAFHVSNRFLDLAPLVARLAREQGAFASVVYEDSGEPDTRTKSDWVLVSRNRGALEAEAITVAGAVEAQERPGLRPWTDDYSNLLQVLK